MLPSVRNHVEWLVCSLRFHLLREGFAFLSFLAAQVGEAGFPHVDITTTGSRAVGLRFALPRADSASPAHSWCASQLTRTAVRDAEGKLLWALPLSVDPTDQQLMHQKVMFARDGDTAWAAPDTLTADDFLSFQELMAELGSPETSLGWCLSGSSVAELENDFVTIPASLFLVVSPTSRLVTALSAKDPID